MTYVNYPSTEYLELPFLDFVCFNVYLEAQDRLAAYLARLHNLCDDRPLVMAEIGLDSRRHGEIEQGRVLEWQLRTIFASGCAGAFVFAWTDEWHRGGCAIEDWDFGLTRRDRSAKPALGAVLEAFADAPFHQRTAWPRISVVVCAFNAQSTIRQCLSGLRKVDYPDFEVIVVDDGSTDATATIAAEFRVRLISTENRGLSRARNTGLAAATGEIVAYLDSDAYPERDWLRFMALAFEDSTYAGVGGPNLAPLGGGRVAECFDNAPGGPVHVLLSDREAEHVPGCNMAFRRDALIAVGGFDAKLRVAGDDVDICWRLQAQGETLGFCPAMVVWHHRRTTVRSYWKQQLGYGRAEAILERKWPEKYNVLGHAMWSGRIYARRAAQALGLRAQRVYSGVWCSAPYQSLEASRPSLAESAASMPEWYVVVAVLGLLSLLGFLWQPLFWGIPVFVLALAVPVLQAVRAAARAQFAAPPLGPLESLRLRAFTAFLHLMQPLARLRGRIEYGLTWWRAAGGSSLRALLPMEYGLWSVVWRSQQSWLETFEQALCGSGALIESGGPYGRWDLNVRGGPLGSARLLSVVEEHGAGKQLIRARSWPVFSLLAIGVSGMFAVLAVVAGFAGAWAACGTLAVIALALAFRSAHEAAAAMHQLDCVIAHVDGAGHIGEYS